MTKLLDRIIITSALVLCAVYMAGCDTKITCDHRFIECAHPQPVAGPSSTLTTLTSVAPYYGGVGGPIGGEPNIHPPVQVNP